MGDKWRVTITIEDEYAGSEPMKDAEQVARFVRGVVAEGSVVEVIAVHVEGRLNIDEE